MKNLKRLVYDIETSFLLAYLFGLGKQVVRHGALLKGANVSFIICITYCIDDGPVKCLKFDEKTGSDADLIKKFDAIVKSCDVVIGKNSDRFDVKHINTQRLLEGLPAFPDWADCSEDLEKQLRKYFYLPSYSLDYVSELLGYGGKRKMEQDDWKNITNFVLANRVAHLSDKASANATCKVFFKDSYASVRKNGRAALDKMYDYGMKDTKDTRDLVDHIAPYVKLRHNRMASADAGQLGCTQCGSTDVTKNGTRMSGNTLKQAYYCKSHGGFAGYRTVNPKTKKLGKITVN